MTLGALVAIVVVVLGALQLPRLFKTKAGGTGQATPQTASTAMNPTTPPAQPENAGESQQQSSPAVSALAPPSQTVPGQSGTATSQAGEIAHPPEGSSSLIKQTPAPSGSKKRVARDAGGPTKPYNEQTNQVAGAAAQAPAEAAAPASQPSPTSQGTQAVSGEASGAKELGELEDRMTPLEGRASAVKDSVEHLRQQQERAGFSLRQDISASESSMEMYMGKAEQALNSRNPQAAKKYMDLAEREIENLEKFFGR